MPFNATAHLDRDNVRRTRVVYKVKQLLSNQTHSNSILNRHMHLYTTQHNAHEGMQAHTWGYETTEIALERVKPCRSSKLRFKLDLPHL